MGNCTLRSDPERGENMTMSPGSGNGFVDRVRPEMERCLQIGQRHAELTYGAWRWHRVGSCIQRRRCVD